MPLGPDHIKAHVTELETEIKEYKIDLKTIEKDVKSKHFEVNLTDCSNLMSLKWLQNEMGWTAAILAKSCPEATIVWKWGVWNDPVLKLWLHRMNYTHFWQSRFISVLSKNDFNSTCEVHKKENGFFQSALFQNRNLVTEITQKFIVFKLKFEGIKK